MSSAVASGFTSISALFNIEIGTFNGRLPSVVELIEAVTNDVHNQIPVSKTAFFKHFAGNTAFNSEDLHIVINILKSGMGNCVESAPAASLSYSHAAIICSSELAARKRESVS